MFQVTATGKNLNYGVKGEVRYIGDNHAKVGVDNRWLEPDMKYLGKGVQNPTLLAESIEKAEVRIRMEKMKITEWKKVLKRSVAIHDGGVKKDG